MRRDLSWTVTRILTDDMKGWEWYAEVRGGDDEWLAQGSFPNRQKAVQWVDAERYNQSEMSVDD